ncbi:unnamed protein product [Caenorhabditis sp. 36 PRJEB53466]|nr:unnamed protein product [Caenorhabditis sp. 36 PRJEB53466]
MDYRLQWDPLQYDNITSIRFAGGENQIWRPDVLLYNSASEDFDSSFKSNEVVYNTGEVNWIPPGIFRASCKMDITYFPFDDQVCYLKFGSWTYHGLALDLSIIAEEDEEEFSIDLSTYTPSGEWHLTKAPAVKDVKYNSCCKEPYSTVTFYMFLRKRKATSQERDDVSFFENCEDECCPKDPEFDYSLSIDSADTLPLPPRPKPLLKKMHSVPAEHLRLDRKVGDGILKSQRRPLVLTKNVNKSHLLRSRRYTQFEKYIKKCIDDAKLRKNSTYSTYSLMIINYYRQIDEMLKLMNRRLDKQRKYMFQQEDWKFAAMALDRLCLLLITVLIVICLFGMFLSTPHFDP